MAARKQSSKCTVCRITKVKDERFMLRNARKLKGTGVFIYEDFSKEMIEIRNTVSQVLEYRREKKFAYLSHQSIAVRDHVK